MTAMVTIALTGGGGISLVSAVTGLVARLSVGVVSIVVTLVEGSGSVVVVVVLGSTVVVVVLGSTVVVVVLGSTVVVVVVVSIVVVVVVGAVVVGHIVISSGTSKLYWLPSNTLLVYNM